MPHAAPHLRRLLVPALAAALAAAAPAAASAATTLGSDLARAGDAAGYCTGDGPGARCTILQLTLGAVDQAVPRDGVITRWSVRDAGGELALRVLDGPAGQRRVVAAGPAVRPTGTGVQTFAAQIAVRAGQRIGLELGDDAHVPFFYRDEKTTGEQYDPPLGADPTAPYAGSPLAATYEILYNATIEPDADADGLGDETQDPDHGGATAGRDAGARTTTPAAVAGCDASMVVARGAGSVVLRTGNRLYGCRDGVRTLIGTRSARVRFQLLRFNGDQLALVRIAAGRSAIQVFDLARSRRTFTSAATSRTISALVVAPDGDAAWTATVPGARRLTTVWVRHGSRVQQIDQGPIDPRSLRLTERATGIYYNALDGQLRNSDFD